MWEMGHDHGFLLKQTKAKSHGTGPSYTGSDSLVYHADSHELSSMGDRVECLHVLRLKKTLPKGTGDHDDPTGGAKNIRSLSDILWVTDFS